MLGPEDEEEHKAQEAYQRVSEFTKQNNRDTKFEQKIQQQKLRVAMRRNILKRNLSEDLVYAAELQSNPNFDFLRYISQNINHYHNNSS